MVTRNRDRFLALTTLFFENRWPHVGMLIVSRSLPNRDPARIAHALAAFNRHNEGDLASYTSAYLQPAPGDQ